MPYTRWACGPGSITSPAVTPRVTLPPAILRTSGASTKRLPASVSTTVPSKPPSSSSRQRCTVPTAASKRSTTGVPASSVRNETGGGSGCIEAGRTELAAPGDDLPGAAELVLELALGVLDAVVLHDCGARRGLVEALHLSRRDRDRDGALGDLADLGRVHEAEPAGAEANVDDQPVEDLRRLVPQDVLDGA